jgi:hypothetical protein
MNRTILALERVEKEQRKLKKVPFLAAACIASFILSELLECVSLLWKKKSPFEHCPALLE